jgi:hypothetical protein
MSNASEPNQPWPIRGVRVDGDRVVITVKGGNDAARWLCGAILDRQGSMVAKPAPLSFKQVPISEFKMPVYCDPGPKVEIEQELWVRDGGERMAI